MKTRLHNPERVHASALATLRSTWAAAIFTSLMLLLALLALFGGGPHHCYT